VWQPQAADYYFTEAAIDMAGTMVIVTGEK
jgi:hypothetical protein